MFLIEKREMAQRSVLVFNSLMDKAWLSLAEILNARKLQRVAF